MELTTLLCETRLKRYDVAEAWRSHAPSEPSRPNSSDYPNKEPQHSGLLTNKRHGYYVAVPAQLLGLQNSVIDELISFAFDTLGAWRLDVRVYDETVTKALVEDER